MESTDDNATPSNELLHAAETSSEAQKPVNPSTDASALTRLLHQEERDRRQDGWAVLLGGIGSTIALMFGLCGPVRDIDPALVKFLVVCFGLLGGAGWGMCLRLIYRSYQRRRAFTTDLSRTQDKRQVGALIRILELPNRRVQNLAKQGLIALLPTLRTSDFALLGNAERRILLWVLERSPKDMGPRVMTELFSRSAYRREVDLRVAILKAFEQVGGDQEIATVERLTHGVSYLSSNFPPEIREAAKACLPFLQQHASEQRARAELLRASISPLPSADTLLRPATAVTETPPEQLLRPGNPSS